MQFSDIHTCRKFVATPINNKASYTMVVIEKENKLIANFILETTKLLCLENSVLQKF